MTSTTACAMTGARAGVGEKNAAAADAVPELARDIVVVGGGSAGLAAAIAAHDAGVESVLVLEREPQRRSWAASSTSASTTALASTRSRRSSRARSTRPAMWHGRASATSSAC